MKKPNSKILEDTDFDREDKAIGTQKCISNRCNLPNKGSEVQILSPRPMTAHEGTVSAPSRAVLFWILRVGAVGPAIQPADCDKQSARISVQQPIRRQRPRSRRPALRHAVGQVYRPLFPVRGRLRKQSFCVYSSRLLLTRYFGRVLRRAIFHLIGVQPFRIELRIGVGRELIVANALA
jgi:hypothetical protein